MENSGGRLSLVPRFIAAAMLVWAVADRHPYAFYTFLRFVTCVVCVMVAVRSHGGGRIGWTWVYAATAVLYNPLIPVHLDRPTWQSINKATIALLLLGAAIEYVQIVGARRLWERIRDLQAARAAAALLAIAGVVALLVVAQTERTPRAQVAPLPQPPARPDAPPPPTTSARAPTTSSRGASSVARAPGTVPQGPKQELVTPNELSRAAPASAAVVPADRFTRGSTAKDVTRVMGTPTTVRRGYRGEEWAYELSTVTFDPSGRVAGWSDISRNLRVTIGERSTDAPFVRRGSTPQQVVAAMGTPSGIRAGFRGEEWSYDLSTISFDAQNRVAAWSDISKILRVTMGDRVPDAPPVRRGATMQDVIAAMGTPSGLRAGYRGEEWSYDLSTISFDSAGRVAAWSDISKNLRVTMGE